MGRLGRTEPFRTSNGDVVAGSIAEVGRVRLGGLDQWVMIRGANVANPLLIALHGGPGFPETRLLRHFNSALEDDFIVVYWEQRGAGKSFSSSIPKSSMTIAQCVSDLDELVDQMRTRFGKDKVFLLGHSWGTALGTLFAARFPQKVQAYVGTGQIGNLQASEEASYAFVLEEAGRRGDKKAKKALEAIGPPPHTSKQLNVQRQWLTRFVGMFRNISILRVLRILTKGPESSVLDLVNIARGALFNLNAMWEQLARLDLETVAPVLDVPVYFFIGRHDHQVDARTSAAYFEKLGAPSKTFVWFEESAHNPQYEEPDKFNRLMKELGSSFNASAG